MDGPAAQSVLSAEAISALAAVFSAIAALIALVVAIRNERKVEERFARQLELEERIARATIAPDVQLVTYSTVGSVEVSLVNCGVGPARVEALSFSRDGAVARSIPQLVALPSLKRWTFYWLVSDGKLTLAPDQTRVLAKLTTDVIADQLDDRAAVDSVLREVKTRITGIRVTYRVRNIVDEHVMDGDVVISELP